MGEPLDQTAIGEDLEGRSRLPPAGRDHVVLQLPKVDVSHLSEHIPCEIDRESPSAQLAIVDIVRVPSQISVERQIDRLGEGILESVITRDRDRESAFVDRETILVEDSHSLEEVVMRATAYGRRDNLLA